MADVHLLGDVRAAIIDHDAARRGDLASARAGIDDDGLGALGKRRIGHAQIDEARPRHLDARQPRIAADGVGHGRGDFARIASGRLGGGQRAIDLKVGQFRPVGRRHAPEARLQPGLGEGARRDLAQRRREIAH